MPWQNEPNFKTNQFRMLEVPSPGIGGINLEDLEYEQDINQSPRMLNMMYRNGSFGKRYGQELYVQLDSTIYAIVNYKGETIVHSGDKVYKIDEDKNAVTLASDVAEVKGHFIKFNNFLYYLQPPSEHAGGEFYQYDGEVFCQVKPYTPDIVINCTPDGTSYNTNEPYNLLSNSWTVAFHGNGTATEFVLPSKECDSTEPIVKMPEYKGDDPIDSSDATYGWEYQQGDENTKAKVIFKTAPPEGVNNVLITGFKTEYKYQEQIYNCKYHALFGGDNNSRLFLGGGGSGRFYYSYVFDATYFPEGQDGVLGNSEEDITGFAKQYNVLIAFKPHEIYSLSYYVQSSSTTTNESQYGKGAFSTQVVNSKIGCDCPGTIQLVNNQLVWLSSTEGVCTLASTNILDERNVKRISRNIERTNNLGVRGILDWEGVQKTVSIDYDQKYFIVHPDSGMAYVWDYGIAPYYNSGKDDNDAKRLSWFLFDNFHASEMIQIHDDCYLVHDNNIKRLTSGFMDVDEPIKAFYQTPLYQFNAVEYLKTVQNIYVETRSDTSSKIEMWYVTEENHDVGDVSYPNYEPNPIEVGNSLWYSFYWDTFQWGIPRFAKIFRRKCKQKKISMMGVYFENDSLGRDMSLSHISLEYALERTIR